MSTTEGGTSSDTSSSPTTDPSTTIDPTTTTASTSTSTTSPMTTDPSTTVSDEVTTAVEESSSDSTLSGNEAAYGVPDRDGGDPIECDVFAQDCPKGEKCMPWGMDDVNWDAARCSPLDPNALDVGDECTQEGPPTSGIDNCGVTDICWNVDTETNLGECFSLCEGTSRSPVCEVPGTSCVFLYEGVLPLCAVECDPMMPVCPDGEQCVAVAEAFLCAPA